MVRPPTDWGCEGKRERATGMGGGESARWGRTDGEGGRGEEKEGQRETEPC